MLYAILNPTNRHCERFITKCTTVTKSSTLFASFPECWLSSICAFSFFVFFVLDTVAVQKFIRADGLLVFEQWWKWGLGSVSPTNHYASLILRCSVTRHSHVWNVCRAQRALEQPQKQICVSRYLCISGKNHHLQTLTRTPKRYPIQVSHQTTSPTSYIFSCFPGSLSPILFSDVTCLHCGPQHNVTCKCERPWLI